MVHDGPSAVQTYCAENFSLGLFDVRMPGMNGVEAFLAIKSKKSDAKVLLMSGYADDALVADALANGARGFISKPFEPEDMLTRLSEICTN
jgi:two-component system, chemotaxis family, chemotaxis protein CheY